MTIPNPDKFEFIKFAQPGDFVEGEYMGSQPFERTPAAEGDFVMSGNIHYVINSDGHPVRFFGKASLDPELVKWQPGRKIRVTFDGIKLDAAGFKTNTWTVRAIE